MDDAISMKAIQNFADAMPDKWCLIDYSQEACSAYISCAECYFRYLKSFEDDADAPDAE